MISTAARGERPAELLGHPKGLATLFFTEMWERFSYYGMRALLVLFMVDLVEDGGLGFSDRTATAIYGLYTAAVYLASLPGGWIADRVLGAQRAVWFGGIVIMSGHFVLAIPATACFFLGLVLVVLGTGLLKPNISAIVGELYSRGDPRRDSGFTIFYMGINIGAAAGPLVCGLLARDDWHYGFAAAGVGMLLGLAQFYFNRAHLGDAGRAPGEGAEPTVALKRRVGIGTGAVLVVIACLLGAGLAGWVHYDAVALAQRATYAIVAIALIYFAYILFWGGLEREERGRVLVIIVLFFAAAMFWSGYEQAGSSLNLFAERYTMREFAGFEIPASWFQSLNPAFIIVLAPLYSMMWTALARRQMDPSSPLKFAIGLIILGVGFAVMIGAATLVVQGQSVLPTWLVFTYLFHTMGELALSPVGLSSVTKLAPRRFVGQMMGIWFLANSLGNILAGLLAGEFRADTLEQMPGLYLRIVLTTVGAGLVLALVAKPLQRFSGEGR